jgi:hypothetical protein
VEVAALSTTLQVDVTSGGTVRRDAWVAAYRSGERSQPVASGPSGAEIELEPGVYDIRCYVRQGGLQDERWIERRDVSGRVRLDVELDLRVATILVRPPARRSSASSDQPNLLLLMDSSAEMDGRLGRGNRMRLVQRALDDLAPELNGLPLELALRVYGIAPTTANACSDSTLLLPLSRLDGDRLADTMGLLRPAGKAPIAYSLERAAEDLPRDGRNVVLLLTGGGDSCGGDVCEAAERLVRRGFAESVHVVALGLGRDARRGLDCAGSYVSVAGLAELRDVLRRVIRGATRNDRGTINVFARGGGWISGGALGERLEVSPGTYDVVIHADGRTYSWKRVEIVGDLEAVAAPRPAFR